ncbi:ATP-dependent DNA helicase RecG [Bacillus piscicola]|uniref:ATP-dependent DNA helicase RecG n=1 Tax=Bacillus piscicola TaxID=1632684 RepID=UPI001F08BE69|nr:ATP-dependent DNA helicase RecG [Bacillus piscicola]
MDECLEKPLSAMAGIGIETERRIQQLGIYTIADMLNYFPYRYENHEVLPVEQLRHGEKVTVAGEIQTEPAIRFYGKKKSRLTIRVAVENILITAVFFNRHFLKNRLNRGTAVTLTGKWDKYKLTITVQDVSFGMPDPTKQIEAVYSITGKVTMKQLRRAIGMALDTYGQHLTETLPEQYRRDYKLPLRREAYAAIHRPETKQQLKHARRRLVYEELLHFQLKMQLFKRRQRMGTHGISHAFTEEKVLAFIQTLPFSLTAAQNRVIKEILDNMKEPFRMNRLLQGDVGSGKTAVAAVVMYAAYLSGFQASLMVPTEILAEQHCQALTELFQGTEVRVALLAGSLKGKKRQEVTTALASGDIHIIVGTHALIQDDVVFHRLGLVITDEQHRFGVEQRRVLRNKGTEPDVLFMTATPIPRTLAISVFGDMDVSVIDELPAGRKQIKTYWVKHQQLERVLQFIDKEIQSGRQAYVICPLIEESEKLDVQNAIDVHAQFQYYFKNYRVGLMHGRLTADEKERVMTDFTDGKVHILVSTTVVEVGVNVPNAAVMLIYDADRFGLSQLHQLRGRVGRGDHQSYCILLADPKGETGKERMQIMQESDDGFVLSEKDLELRGPGDFFGHKQSGLPDFKIADVVHDYRALETARKDASELIAGKAFWVEEEWAALRKYVETSGALDDRKLD